LIWLLMLASSQFASAASVAHLPFSFSYDRPLTIPPSPASDAVRIRFLFEDPGGVDDPNTEIFDSYLFDAADAGRRVVLTADGDPEFDAFIMRVTNGIDDRLLAIATGNNGGGGGFSNYESSLLSGPGGPGADLFGLPVEAMVLYINAIEIDPSAGVRDQNWSVTGRLAFHDSAVVPVPPAAALLASALVMLGMRLRPRTT
jgi:hypothetical protein